MSKQANAAPTYEFFRLYVALKRYTLVQLALLIFDWIDHASQVHICFIIIYIDQATRVPYTYTHVQTPIHRVT